MSKFTFRHFLAYLRRQPRHIQHVYSILIAGSITGIITAFILYTDYGFWHERYIAQNEDGSTATPVVLESPSEMISRFWNEAKSQVGSIKTTGDSLLIGTDTYKKDDVNSTTTEQ